MPSLDLRAVEALATELLRERLLMESDPREQMKWIERFAELAGEKIDTRRFLQEQVASTFAIARVAFVVGVAVGQRLQPNALLTEADGR